MLMVRIDAIGYQKSMAELICSKRGNQKTLCEELICTEIRGRSTTNHCKKQRIKLR